MALLGRNDLQFAYDWRAIPPDDPRITGKPDSTLLNRNEGYEVLSFINRLAVAWNFKQVASGHKIERMIKEHLPGNIRSHAHVREWIRSNWEAY